jgi:hypothetical protein
MSTPQSIALTPGLRIGRRTTLIALGLLLAIAMTLTVLTLTSSGQTTGTTAAAASYAVGGSTQQVRYLGPRQEHAIPQNGGGTSTAAPSTLLMHYTCLGAVQRCLR